MKFLCMLIFTLTAGLAIASEDDFMTYECSLSRAPNQKPDSSLGFFVIRTPDSSEIETKNEFSVRWLTFKFKITRDGTFQYAINEYGQKTAVATGFKDLKKEIKSRQGFQFFIERKITSPKLNPQPSHYSFNCK